MHASRGRGAAGARRLAVLATAVAAGAAGVLAAPPTAVVDHAEFQVLGREVAF